MIAREPAAAAADPYDLIVVGGGIYGVMLALEASRRNLRTLLLEKADFGSQTSFNSLRIIHGGLRYLQALDLTRFRESVAERQWFLRTFPGLVKPLPCLMPLYGEGLRRPSVLRTALAVNHLLSLGRNKGVASASHLPRGAILSAATVKRLFPEVDRKGLQGGALWYDAVMPDSQRIVMEALRWACGNGARALNYTKAAGLLTEGGRVSGIVAYDREGRREHAYRSRVVVNAAGPWSRLVLSRLHRDRPDLFHPSLAWNVLLDRESPSCHALALTAREPGAHTYFLVPWKGRLLAGTGHSPWNGHGGAPQPSEAQLLAFLAGLNQAAPGLDISPREIRHVFAGLLPAARAGTALLATRPMVIDHRLDGGPQGLYSISGVKFTTSRLVAEKTICRIFSNASFRKESAPAIDARRGIYLNGAEALPYNELKCALKALWAEEAACRLDDLLLRRTDLWLDGALCSKLADLSAELLSR